jgi:heptosyltransferase-2
MTDHSAVSVVMQTAFLGDMILTTPLIERLAARGPVHVVATPANSGILANHPAVASVIVFDKRRTDRGLGGMRRVAAAVKATGATTAYLAQGSLRTAALARMAGISERVGFDTSPGRLVDSRSVRFDKSLHHTQRLWQLANAPGDATVPPALRPSLFPCTGDIEQVNALLAAHGVDADSPLVALAPGSVWATKRWPSFDALATQLLADVPLAARLVVLGGPDDRPLAAAIVKAAGAHRIIDATGSLSLLASAELLRRARVLVTNDSAPLHLASAMNTPTVALFGPTLPAFGFGPLADYTRIAEVEGLSCRPCGAHGAQSCPQQHWRCMRDLQPVQLAQLARAVSSERPS